MYLRTCTSCRKPLWDDGGGQDIAVIVEIMQQTGGVKEQTKYYWYVGQENPSNIGAVANATADKWTELGNRKN